MVILDKLSGQMTLFIYGNRLKYLEEIYVIDVMKKKAIIFLKDIQANRLVASFQNYERDTSSCIEDMEADFFRKRKVMSVELNIQIYMSLKQCA